MQAFVQIRKLRHRELPLRAPVLVGEPHSLSPLRPQGPWVSGHRGQQWLPPWHNDCVCRPWLCWFLTSPVLNLSEPPTSLHPGSPARAQESQPQVSRSPQNVTLMTETPQTHPVPMSPHPKGRDVTEMLLSRGDETQVGVWAGRSHGGHAGWTRGRDQDS